MNLFKVSERVLPLILFAFLLINTLSLFQRDLGFAPYGELSLTVTLYFAVGLFVLFTLKHYFNHWGVVHQKLVPVYLTLAAFLLVYAASHFWNDNSGFDTLLLQFLLSYLFFLAVILIEWTDFHLRVLTFVANGLILFIFLAVIILDMPMNLFSSAYMNSNSAALIIYCLLFLQMIGFKFTRGERGLQIVQLIFLGLTLFLIYVSSSRAVLLAVGVSLLAWLVYRFFRKLYSWLFFIVIGFNALFLFIYTRQEDMFFITFLNRVSNTLFNKDIFTGREAIWRQAMEHGMTSPFLGHLIDMRPRDYTPGTAIAHVHNYYLQTFLESGILGVLALLLLLFVIWTYFQRSLHNDVVRISSFFYLGILFYWNLDLSNFFINQAVGLLLWFIIGIGVSASVYQQVKERQARDGRRG